MKKILSFLSISSLLITGSINTISCFGRNKDTSITDRDVTDQLIDSAISASWYSNIGSATNISLLGGKQLIVSNVQSDNPISDVNLDFSGNEKINDGCTGSEKYFIFYDNKLYTKQGCDAKLWYFEIGSADADGNYWPNNTLHHQTTVEHTMMPTISNNNVYAIDGTSKIIYNATDVGNIIQVSSLDNFADFTDVTNLFAICNIDDELYVGTNAGLYKSEDNGTTYSLIKKTEGLAVNTIIPSDNKVYFGTNENGLWYSSITSTSATQINNTQDKKINANSLSIINNNLYFGIENEGLYILNNLSSTSINRLVGTNIAENENIKTIIKDDNNDLLILTSKNIVKIKMSS